MYTYTYNIYDRRQYISYEKKHYCFLKKKIYIYNLFI